jgi:hypothetical protein
LEDPFYCPWHNNFGALSINSFMQNNTKGQQPTKPDKGAAPQSISGSTIADTKKKTEPLQEDKNKREDQREGKMNNGELGADINKE